ncbi:MAG TPA: hypothetical protein DEP23_14235 [Ruminococcaceae bacterium]|nr:hypothetical protein [Oscillospiraceae bacterium]
MAHENDSQFHSLILNASKFLLIQPLDQLMPQVLEGRKIDLSRYYSSYGQAFDSFVQKTGCCPEHFCTAGTARF